MEEEKTIKELYDIDADAPYYPSGAVLLDEVVGGGVGLGYPGGKLINLAGIESAGKSFLAWQTIASNYYHWKKKDIPFKWVYDDAENGNTINPTEKYGIEPPENSIKSSNSMEELHYNLRRFLEELNEDERGVYVLDSLDPLKTEEDKKRQNTRMDKMDEGKNLEKGSFAMTKQKYLSNDLLPDVTPLIKQKKALVIIVSQMRYNIDPRGMGPKYTISGGKAADHYYTIRLQVKRQKTYEKTYLGNKREYGVGVIVSATKNKCPRPGRECQLDIFYTKGVDDVGSCADFLFDLKTATGQVTKRGVKIEWNGQTFTTKKDFLSYVRKNKQLKKLKDATIDKWEAIEDAMKKAADEAMPEFTWDMDDE